jgi:PAS domain S-box-containing protein
MHKTEKKDAELRCTSCKKLLAVQKGGSDCEVKCTRCGALNIIVEHIHEQIIITDKEGIILFVNPETEAVTGYSASEIIGKKPSLWGGNMSKKFSQELWRTIKDEKAMIRVHVRNRRKSGLLYDAELHITPVLDAEGEIRFFVGVESVISSTAVTQDYSGDSSQPV